MRATLVHEFGCSFLINPPQLGQVRRFADRRVESIDVAQCSHTIAVFSWEWFIPDRLEYVANPERRDVIDYAGYAAQRPALRRCDSFHAVMPFDAGVQFTNINSLCYRQNLFNLIDVER